MNKYNINYGIQGMFTFMPLFEIVEADTEEEARKIFIGSNKNIIIYDIEKI